MSNKFNTHALTEFSKAYARRVAGDFYQNQSVISGKQILTLTPVGQVNLFIISGLSGKWRADAEKLRSPYFDFANPEVEEALQTFMNVVSQHISVRREHLEPLLIEATRRSICLLFDPRGYFDEILREMPDFMITADNARQLTRYTQIHKIIPATLEQRMNGKPFVYANQALGYLDEILTQHGHELDQYEKYVALFSEKVPMDLSALLRNRTPDALPSQGGRSFFDTELESDTSVATVQLPNDTSQIPAEEPTKQPEPTDAETEALERTRESAIVDEPAAGGTHFLDGQESGPDPVAPIGQPSQVAESSPELRSLPEATDREETAVTLNDRLRETTAEPTTVGEAFHRASIESIAKSISLNQKFRFINQLFNGQTASYNQAIEELDKVSTYGQALDLISYRYASQYFWDMSSDEVGELVEILKRRFA